MRSSLARQSRHQRQQTCRVSRKQRTRARGGVSDSEAPKFGSCHPGGHAPRPFPRRRGFPRSLPCRDWDIQALNPGDPNKPRIRQPAADAEAKNSRWGRGSAPRRRCRRTRIYRAAGKSPTELTIAESLRIAEASACRLTESLTKMSPMCSIASSRAVNGISGFPHHVHRTYEPSALLHAQRRCRSGHTAVLDGGGARSHASADCRSAR